MDTLMPLTAELFYFWKYFCCSV